MKRVLSAFCAVVLLFACIPYLPMQAAAAGDQNGSNPQPRIAYTNIPQGVYYLMNNLSGEYLSVSGGVDAQGTNVNTWKPDRSYMEEMEIVPASNVYKIHPKCSSSRVISVNGYSVTAGMNVDIRSDVNNTNQWWGFEKVSGGYVIRNMQNQNCVLALATNSQNVVVQNYTGAKNQIWTIIAKKAYTVTYNANGGYNTPAYQTKGFDENLKLTTQIPTRNGYDFLGWSTKATATTATYSSGGTYSGNASVTLFAVWKKHVHSYSGGKCTACGYTPTGVKLTQQPFNHTVASGKWASTTVKATGDGLKYQWYYRNPGASSFVKSSLKTNLYSAQMTKSNSGRQVYCVITDKYGNSIKTKTATLTMQTPLKITQQPFNETVTAGKWASTTVKATGDGLKYQWYYRNPGASSFVKSSLKTNLYSAQMTKSNSGRQVYCVITDKYGNSIKTKTATLTMQTPLKITKQPVSVTVASGSQAKVTLTAAGDGLKYQWYVKNAGATTWGKSSLTGNSYYVTMKSTTKNRQVYCVVTDKYGNSVKSNVVTLKMK